jgi:predicted MFS family arabinose efflux permease
MVSGATQSAPAREVVLDRRLAVLLAFVTGAAAACLYYAQPLLGTIASAFGTTEAAAGLIVTASLGGYAVGVVLLVPLGDLLERRGFLVRLLLACALALLVAAMAPSIGVLALALGAVGMTCVVAQIIVPLASDLAPEGEPGRTVGIVMSGLLIGVLAARTISGALAALAGWRAPFVLAAVLMLLAAAALRFALPVVPARNSTGYFALLRSIGTLLREEAVLRVRMAYGALGMATFMLLWTSLTFLLAGPAYGYGEATIGLFGLAGIAGALAAQAAGHLADRGRGRQATGLAWLSIAVAWGLCAAGNTSLAPLVAGIIVLDAGVALQHISNQSAIYALRPGARSRLTTAYMTGHMVSGALGSALASAAWVAGGWVAVSLSGGCLAAVALLVWSVEPRLTRTS